ncbi:MAG: hypothetical protein ABI036_14510 [Fibrobacteria bacterium]
MRRSLTGGKVPSGLSLPFTPSSSENPFSGIPEAIAVGVSPTAAIRALPGLGAWSLDCRRKTLRGVLRAWLLKSRKPVR